MTYMPSFVQPQLPNAYQNNLDIEAELLRERSQESLSRLLTAPNIYALKSVYKTRLEEEIQILEHKGFCGYFLIVADYVHWAKDNGIAVGPGRGSGPCSLVGFILGITTIDPIKYSLPFERFVNPDRDTTPDFDLEFCEQRYGEVANYLQSKYGADHVAQISTADNTPLPARLVICDRPLSDLVPLYSNPHTGFPAARMTAAQIKHAGLVQFNVINQKALTVIQHTVQALANAGTVIDINNISLDDEDAYRILSSGEMFNFTDPDYDHYKKAIVAVRPDRFENLCAAMAFSHQNLHNYIPLFLKSMQQSEHNQCFHPALENITSNTYGLILYQEQVMHIAHNVAGFSMAQGDSFRRALKQPGSETLAMHRALFIEGAINLGLQPTDATGVFEHVSKWGQRSVNKSHYVAFAMIAYQSAWLKANYSIEFEYATPI